MDIWVNRLRLLSTSLKRDEGLMSKLNMDKIEGMPMYLNYRPRGHGDPNVC